MNMFFEDDLYEENDYEYFDDDCTDEEFDELLAKNGIELEEVEFSPLLNRYL